MAPFTEDGVRQLFAKIERGDWTGFFENVADDVHWTVTNPRLKTQPLSGVYLTKKDFQAALAPLQKCFASPLALTVQHVSVGQPSADGTQTAAVELRAQSRGKTTDMEFDNYYCWVCVMDPSKKPSIVRVRAYLDSALVKDIMAKEAP